MEHRPKRQRRVKKSTQMFDFDDLENREQILLQRALANSRRDTHRVQVDVPFAPTFRPTVEEFKDPMAYITSITSQAEQFGICKIVPPSGWAPKINVDLEEDTKYFKTKLQEVHTLQQGNGFDDGRNFTMKSYRAMAEEKYSEYVDREHGGKQPTFEELSKCYWDMVETGAKKAVVEYGNDIDTTVYGSGFPTPPAPASSEATNGVETADCDDMFSDAYYARTGWNLNSIAGVKGSVLKRLETKINGVNVPWLYIGMLFSSFCWHNEDNYLYSINYSHYGSTKQWYGLAGEKARKFEQMAKNFLYQTFEDAPDLLHHMTTQISPSLLVKQGLPVYQIQQGPGEFVITFPKAFHAGFSYGFNVGEAVNFATSDWIAKGTEAEARYREFARPSVFSHVRLLFTLVEHLGDVDPQYTRQLFEQILEVVDEEMYYRPFAFNQGIRDVRDLGVKLPKNDFRSIDESKMNYDEMRTCALCKCVCVFTALACECDSVRVHCLRHRVNQLCSCSVEKKYIVSWASMGDLIAIRNNIMRMYPDLAPKRENLNTPV